MLCWGGKDRDIVGGGEGIVTENAVGHGEKPLSDLSRP